MAPVAPTVVSPTVSVTDRIAPVTRTIIAPTASVTGRPTAVTGGTPVKKEA